MSPDGATTPRLRETNAGYGGQEVDTIGRMPQLQDPIGFSQVACAQLQIPESERLQCLQYALHVFGCRPNEYVYVTGKARVSMECDRVAANNEVLNFR